jgi:hypothetical protein
MTAKQLAQRLGAAMPQLDFSFAQSCAECRRTGGTVVMTCPSCVVQLCVAVTEVENDIRH